MMTAFFAATSLIVSQMVASQASLPPPAEALPPEIVAWCGHLSKELRSVHRERCLTRPWKSESSSLGGHPIPHYYWGNHEAPPLAPSSGPEGGPKRVLILGALHGDEISSVSMVFRWIDFLERTRADSFLRRNYYLFFPLVNPDGFHSKPRQRTNQAGVDINRNFATNEWDEKAIDYWRRKTGSDPRRNPGKKAGSETETQVVERAIRDFKPDMIISVHAPYCLVDHDGPINFPDSKSPLPVRTLGSFPGSLGTYAGVERGIPVVTPELPSAKQMPDQKSIEQLFLFIMRAKY